MFTASKITIDALHRLTALTIFCGNDPVMPILAAVNVSVSDGKVHGVATDRYSAALWAQDTANEYEPVETLAPPPCSKTHTRAQRAPRPLPSQSRTTPKPKRFKSRGTAARFPAQQSPATIRPLSGCSRLAAPAKTRPLRPER